MTKRRVCFKSFGVQSCTRKPVLNFAGPRASLDTCIYHGITILWAIVKGNLPALKVSKI